jgi:hypothetical protein
MRSVSCGMAAALMAAAVVAGFGSAARADTFSFGVMADTQWSGSDPTGNNINTVAVNQAKACNLAFINAGVSFVVQVGDLGDNGSVASLQTRLDCNSSLTAAGIPFYGLRGNHEDNSACQTFFQANYIPGSSASAVVAVAPSGVDYSVTYKNTKIVLLDILTADSASAMDSATVWMNSQLSAADHQQAFVFQHKNLLGQNHKDNAFGGSNDANPAEQNAFISALANNGVRYDISGHDHMHYRSEITSPDGLSKVQEIISASDSYKYYTPGAPFSSRDGSISQQLAKTGYYIYTVDGPRVTGKYYETTPLANGDVPANPVWKLSETFGYSLNGKQFLVPSGGDLSVVQDSFNGTHMNLTGSVTSTIKTADGRLLTKDINTGWTENNGGFGSDVLTLWGLEDIDSAVTGSPFTLTMTPSGNFANMMIQRQNFDGSWTALSSVINGDGSISAVVTSDGTFAVTPEPASLGILALGVVGLISRRLKA